MPTYITDPASLSKFQLLQSSRPAFPDSCCVSVSDQMKQQGATPFGNYEYIVYEARSILCSLLFFTGDTKVRTNVYVHGYMWSELPLDESSLTTSTFWTPFL